MDFSYENQGANTYLVYEIKEGDSIDTLSLGMLTNNSIPGLTRALLTQMDEKRYIKYNVSSKVSMQQFFGGVVNRKRLLGVFNGITEGFLSAEDYMIDTSSIVLDPEYIFADVTTCAAALICLPIANAEGTEPDLGAFFKSVVVNAQTDPTEDSDHVAKILNFLNSSSVFSLPGFKKLLDDLRNEPSAPTVTVEVKKIPNGQPSVGAPAVPPVQKTVPVHVPPAQPIITPAVPPAVPQPPQQQTQESPKEEMSLLHLLTHYSKENKALYDQQKATQKGKPKQAVSKPSKPAKTERHANQSAKSQSFAVPGVEQRGSAPSFAIPGQSAPAVQPVIQTPPQPKPQIPVTPVVQQPAAVQPVQIPVQPPVQTIPMVQTGEKMDFGNTTILNGGGRVGETTVLNNASQQSRRIAPYLIRSRNHEEIAVNKPQFRIGKERSYVDYFIGDNPAISRSHATIITRENTYFIVDTNSTNHTYVDGKMIQPNTEVPIQQGTKIRLGNEDFEFKLR